MCLYCALHLLTDSVVRRGAGRAARQTVRGADVEFYGSLRAVIGSDGRGVKVRDNASRLGLFATRPFRPGHAPYGRIELGLNVVDAFDRILNPKANAPEDAGTITPRLGYVGLDTPYGRVSLGKQWSGSYAVAVLTDRFGSNLSSAPSVTR